MDGGSRREGGHTRAGAPGAASGPDHPARVLTPCRPAAPRYAKRTPATPHHDRNHRAQPSVSPPPPPALAPASPPGRSAGRPAIKQAPRRQPRIDQRLRQESEYRRQAAILARTVPRSPKLLGCVDASRGSTAIVLQQEDAERPSSYLPWATTKIRGHTALGKDDRHGVYVGRSNHGNLMACWTHNPLITMPPWAQTILDNLRA